MLTTEPAEDSTAMTGAAGARSGPAYLIYPARGRPRPWLAGAPGGVSSPGEPALHEVSNLQLEAVDRRLRARDARPHWWKPHFVLFFVAHRQEA